MIIDAITGRQMKELTFGQSSGNYELPGKQTNKLMPSIPYILEINNKNIYTNTNNKIKRCMQLHEIY